MTARKHSKRTFQYFILPVLCISGLTAIASISNAGTSSSAHLANQEPSTVEITYETTRKAMRKFGLEYAPAKAEGTLRLTTYNIENLFDTHDDPSLTGRNDDKDEAKPTHELIATAMAIRAVDADVLCVQEIESEAALLEYRDQYLSGMGYDHVISIDAGNDRGIENAVLSRYPILAAQNWPKMPLGGVHPELYGTQKNWYAGEPIEFRRSPLRVDLQIPSEADSDSWILTLFVMHHKSGRFNDYWREAEATGTLELINEVLEKDPDRPIVILGDFNAEPDADSAQTYLQSGFADVFAGRRANAEIVTHESGRRIDLIFANDSAFERIEKPTAFVYGTAARPEGTSYRDLDTFDGYAADHYPVSVDLSK